MYKHNAVERQEEARSQGPCKPCFIFVLKMPGEIRVQEGVEIIHRARVLRGQKMAFRS